MLQQVEFALRPRPRGFHLVTDEVLRQLPELPVRAFAFIYQAYQLWTVSL